MTANPWCAVISELRQLLYNEAHEVVRDSKSTVEAVGVSLLLAGIIEVDTAMLRALAGCPQAYPAASDSMCVRGVATGTWTVIPGPYWKVQLIS